MKQIYCSIDTDNLDHAASLSKAAVQGGAAIKYGLQFFNAHGPQGIQKMIEANPGISVFLDLKYHDIPNTVAMAVRAATPLGVDYLNVHASGGIDMMKAAKDAAVDEAQKRNIPAPKILAVTVLTSLDDHNMKQIGYQDEIEAQVIRLAKLTQDAGLDGIVCSPHEITAVRKTCGDDFILMVPGIRPASHQSGSDDQKRFMTPQQAIEAGATHLVIGRPITQSDDPASTAQNILAEIS